MKKKIFLILSLVAAAALIYSSCTKDDSDVIENLATIEVTPDVVFFSPGLTQQFTATGTFLDGTTRDITEEVTWKSKFEDVATIDEKGLATGVKKGYTYISASSGFTLGSALANVVASTEMERNKIIQDYLDNYIGSENPDCGWTGDAASCDPGTITSTSYDKVIQRVNYFRRLCGLHDNITLKAQYNEKCQIAALMFRANNTINHYPPPSWLCYDPDGDEAAGKSNIAIGFHTSAAVSAYIDDFGANNISVGHRRWILYTKANAMGEGSTINTEALWVFDHLSQAPAGTPDWVSYPAKGYFPAPLVFDRWSFMMPGATFGSTYVTMKDANGNNVSLNVIDRYTGGGLAGDPAIVWEPSNINTSSNTDVKYTVTISNIGGNVPYTEVTYDVIIVKPVTSKSGEVMETEYQRIRRENPNARVL